MKYWLQFACAALLIPGILAGFPQRTTAPGARAAAHPARLTGSAVAAPFGSAPRADEAHRASVQAGSTESRGQAIDRLTVEGKTNPAAAYDAYLLAAQCARQQRLASWIVNDPPGAGREGMEKELTGLKTLCKDVTQRQLDDRLANVEIAARAGVKGAAMAFSFEGPFGDPRALVDRPNDPTVVAWKSEMMSLLTRDGEGGDVNALVELSVIYSDSGTVSRDAPRALMYLEAAADIVALEEGNSTGAREIEQVSAGIERQFSADQLAAIKSRARGLVKACCRRAG